MMDTAAELMVKDYTAIFVPVTIPPGVSPMERSNLEQLNEHGEHFFKNNVCTIKYPSTTHETNVNDAWDQHRADIFVKNITAFEDYVRLNEILNDEDDDVEH